MESNYDAIIEKKSVPALSLMKQGERKQMRCLRSILSSQDAYVALGMAITSSDHCQAISALFCVLAACMATSTKGMELMSDRRRTRPLPESVCKIMLALAYEREHQPEKARVLLSELSVQFPSNPIFAHELVLVDQKQTCCKR